MRRPVRARKRILRPTGLSVSLFPFLAVLICTMGALILLLVIIARQARLQAALAVKAENNQTADWQEELELERELAELLVSQVTESRQKTEAQLAEARLQLGHIEDHAHQLSRQLAKLEAAWAELDALEVNGSRRREGSRSELAALSGRIAGLKEEIAEAKHRAADRRPSYAIIPYEGPNETHRRPIYIDCRADAVVIEPEGIVLTEADFEGPLGPGNPLDVALRATREYLLSQSEGVVESSEPYPLLLVRPSGIEAYYAARSAMKSWGSEFGYELIGDDWTLKYRTPDPELARVLKQATQTARIRQQILAAAAPRRYGRPQRPKYVVRPHRGGVVRQGGSDDHEGPGFVANGASGRFGGRIGSAGGSSAKAASRPEGFVAGRPPAKPDPAAKPSGVARRPGEWMPPARREEDGRGGREVESRRLSLAKIRGRNWGLPDAADGSVPITRPIRVHCYPDRLEIVPERGLPGGQVIALEARTENSIDTFISAIWDYMDSWGIAGRGMYWRPILNVHVAPGAEHRFADLETLLDASGLEVMRNED